MADNDEERQRTAPQMRKPMGGDKPKAAEKDEKMSIYEKLRHFDDAELLERIRKQEEEKQNRQRQSAPKADDATSKAQLDFLRNKKFQDQKAANINAQNIQAGVIKSEAEQDSAIQPGVADAAAVEEASAIQKGIEDTPTFAPVPDTRSPALTGLDEDTDATLASSSPPLEKSMPEPEEPEPPSSGISPPRPKMDQSTE